MVHLGFASEVGDTLLQALAPNPRESAQPNHQLSNPMALFDAFYTKKVAKRRARHACCALDAAFDNAFKSPASAAA